MNARAAPQRNRSAWRAGAALAGLAVVAAAEAAAFASGGLLPAAIALVALVSVCGLWLGTAVADWHEETALRDEIASLRETLGQQSVSAKLLVRRDLELTRLNERLRELDRLKSDFVTVATHQLRTPLSAIRWTLKMLAGGDVGPVNEDQRRFLMQAYDSNSRLIVLLRDMLLADQIESGRLETGKENSSPVAVAEEVVAEVNVLAEKQGVTLRLSKPDASPAIRIDAPHLRAVVQNLLENAIKYTPRGGEVTLAISPKTDAVDISISDTGIGIPADVQHNIFSRFFRAQNAITMVTDGSGLGLFIAKRIIEASAGTLSFSSTQGKGTTFVVTLPVAR